MRYIILLVALLSCGEELTPSTKHCYMTISDALPVQFWLNGEQTFNEKTVCGIIKQDCYCQPFNCDQEIQIIIIDSFTFGEIVLQILDENSVEIDAITFARSGVNLTVSFVPSDYSPCKEKLQLKIISIPIVQPLTSWINQGTGTSWTISAAPAISVTPSGVSKFLIGTFDAIEGYSYDIAWDIDLINSLIPKEIYLLDSSFNIVTTQFIDVGPTGNYTGISTLTPTSRASYLAFRLFVDDASIDDTIMIVNSVSYNGGNIELFKSDCLEIKEDTECTKLIEYSNASAFDGIPYINVSPPSTFYLRVPATFYEEENPQEQEDLELSNGQIVTLRQSLQEKRLFETGYMPNYMHKKLQKVLMHETIVIDGDQWKRRDEYKAASIKKYNLKKASVLLTKYNSVLKNTI